MQNLQLFQKNLQDPITKNIVRKHAEKFLQTNGRKKLSTPLQMECFSLVLLTAGRFSDKPPQPPIKPENFTFFGKVTKMDTLERRCNLYITKKQQMDVYYNENEYFLKLKEMLGEPLEAVFHLERTAKADGKEMIRMRSIENIEKDPDLLT